MASVAGVLVGGAPLVLGNAGGGVLGVVSMVGSVIYTGRGVVAIAIAALLMGLLQSLALRTASRFWYLWPLINLAILVPVASFQVTQGMQNSFMSLPVLDGYWLGLGAVTGLVGGMVKGGALIWLLKFPFESAPTKRLLTGPESEK